MKVISIATRKGGQGKTMTSFNLGYKLASEHKKTLLLDFDSQGSLTTITNKPFSIDIYNVLCGDYPITDAILKVTDNLDFLPTSQLLENIDMEFADTNGKQYLLKKALDSVTSQYDFVIIDTTPANSLALINALVASDEVIIPVNADYMSYDGFTKFLHVVEKVRENLNEELKILGVVINSKRNSNHSHEVTEALRRQHDVLPVLAEFKMAVSVMDSMVEGKPLFLHSPRHENTTELEKLYKEVIK